jgi:hypothetical protein
MTLPINCPEQFIIRLDFRITNEGSAYRTWNRLISIQDEHAFNAYITEKVIMRASKHRPSFHNVIGLVANITHNSI